MSAPDFFCTDCGQGVFDLSRTWCPVPPRCRTCEWLVENVPDLEERAELREFLTL